MNSLKAPKISKRLLLAASFARKGDFVADVGTDHAYLPIYLYKSGIIRGAVVSDVNEGPIVRAANNIAEFSCKGAIIPLLSDGLCKIDEYSPDTVFILGMGGELIVNILSRAEWIKNKILVSKKNTSSSLTVVISKSCILVTDIINPPHHLRQKQYYPVIFFHLQINYNNSLHFQVNVDMSHFQFQIN